MALARINCYNPFVNVKLRIIVDANAFITACKFTLEQEVLIDLLLHHCQIELPPSVAEETTRNLRHPDAHVAAQRLAAGLLAVQSPTAPILGFLDEYHLGRGEKEAIRLYLSNPDGIDFLITDDKLAYLVCGRMGIAVRLLPDLIIELVRRGSLTKIQAEKIIDVTSPRYSAGIVAHSRALLEEVSTHA
jgi:predicted nucleic acid-binding protein